MFERDGILYRKPEIGEELTVKSKEELVHGYLPFGINAAMLQRAGKKVKVVRSENHGVHNVVINIEGNTFNWHPLMFVETSYGDKKEYNDKLLSLMID